MLTTLICPIVKKATVGYILTLYVHPCAEVLSSGCVLRKLCFSGA